MCHVAGTTSLCLSILLSYYTRTETGTYGQVIVSEGIFNIKKTYIRTYKDVALNNSNGLSDKSIISL